MAQPDYTTLIDAALEGRARAYAPYSRFAVGAAVLTASGKLFQGCNIENAAYSVGVCAERVALFSAYAAGERDLVALAVVTSTNDVASPCGACRQVIFELASNSAIILLNLQGDRRLTNAQELLPHGFGSLQLDESREGGWS